MNKRPIAFVVLLVSAILIAMAAVRQGLDLQMDPPLILAAILGFAIGLALLTTHPAALIIPFLFAPQYKALPYFSHSSETQEFTLLAVTAFMVGVAMFIRLMRPSPDGVEVSAAFRGQWNGIRAFLVFAGIVTVSYVYTTAPVYGEDKLLRFVAFGGLAFFAPFVLLQSDQDIRDFVVGTVVFALVVAAYSMRLASSGPSGAGENPVHIGMGQLIGMAILLLVYYPISDPRLQLVAQFVLIPVLALGLVSSLTRGPILGVLLVLGLSLVLPSMASAWVSRKMMALSLAAAVAVVLVLVSGLFRGRAEARLQQKVSEIQELAEGSASAHGSAVQRLSLYTDAAQAIEARPVLGWGVGGWIRYFNHTDFLDLPRPAEGHYKSGHVRFEHYPHNLFLEVASEEGFLGLAALLFFLATVFGAWRRNRGELGGRFPFLLPLFIYLLTVTQVSGEIVDNRFLWFWCAVMLMACELNAVRPLEEPSPSEFEEAEAAGEASPAIEGL